MEPNAIDDLLARHAVLFAAHDAAGLAAQHAPEGTFSSPAAGVVTGRRAIEQVYRYWFTAFPDMRFTWRPPLAQGNRVALFWSFSGSLQGPFFGVTVPGARVQMSGAAEYTLSDEGIATADHLFDFSQVLIKAGVMKIKPTS